MFGFKSKNLGEELKNLQAKVAAAEEKAAADAARIAELEAALETAKQEATGTAGESVAMAAELEEARKTVQAQADKIAETEGRLAAALEETAELKERLAKPLAVYGDATEGESEPVDPPAANALPAVWKEALEKCGGDYAAAREMYPEAYAKAFPGLAKK